MIMKRSMWLHQVDFYLYLHNNQLFVILISAEPSTHPNVIAIDNDYNCTYRLSLNIFFNETLYVASCGIKTCIMLGKTCQVRSFASTGVF